MTTTMKKSYRTSPIVVNLMAGLWMITSAEAAFANLESHGAQGAVAPGTASTLSAPAMPVQYSGGGSPPADGGGAEWSNCASTDDGQYIIGQGEVGKYGGGYWYAESNRTGEKTYNPYGTYKGVMGALTWKDHPTETDAAAAFIGSSLMVGKATPKTRLSEGGEVWARQTGPFGVRGGIEIEFPGLGEVGELIKNEIVEDMFTPEFARQRGWSDPENVDLAKLEWPELKLSGAFLSEAGGSVGLRGRGANIGGGAGYYNSGTINLSCMETEAYQWITDDLVSWYQNDLPSWIMETSSGLEESVSGAVDTLRGIFDPSFDIPFWGR